MDIYQQHQSNMIKTTALIYCHPLLTLSGYSNRKVRIITLAMFLCHSCKYFVDILRPNDHIKMLRSEEYFQRLTRQCDLPKPEASSIDRICRGLSRLTSTLSRDVTLMHFSGIRPQSSSICVSFWLHQK